MFKRVRKSIHKKFRGVLFGLVATLVSHGCSGHGSIEKFLQYNKCVGCNLSNQDFRGANLDQANLENSSFDGADFSGAVLTKSNLKGADLEGTNLSRANLEDANLRGANLENSNL